MSFVEDIDSEPILVDEPILGLIPEELSEQHVLLISEQDIQDYIEAFDQIDPELGYEQALFDPKNNELILTHRHNVRSVNEVKHNTQRGLVVSGITYSILQDENGIFYGEVHDFKHILGTNRYRSYNVRPFSRDDYLKVFGVEPIDQTQTEAA